MKYYIILISLLCIHKAYTQTPIVVTNQNLNITGSLTAGAWQSNNGNKPFPNYPKMYYAFAAGDEIAIDFVTNNGKGKQRITVTEYESGSVAYSNNAFKTLNDIRIKIPKTAIYQFEFATNHLLDRQCNVIIKRIPAADAPANFNYNVNWKVTNDTIYTTTQETVKTNTRYEAVSIQTPINHYVNSITNLTGTTRISFPITLPPNTVEWYYTFAATRNKSDVAKTKLNMQLFAELSKVIDASGSLSFGINALSEPPGANYCDVFVLPQESNTAFLQKTTFNHYPEASRANLMSGIVKVKNCCQTGNYCIGFRNNDMRYGIEVMIEVVAITKHDIYETRTVRTPASIIQNKIPYIAD